MGLFSSSWLEKRFGVNNKWRQKRKSTSANKNCDVKQSIKTRTLLIIKLWLDARECLKQFTPTPYRVRPSAFGFQTRLLSGLRLLEKCVLKLLVDSSRKLYTKKIQYALPCCFLTPEKRNGAAPPVNCPFTVAWITKPSAFYLSQY